MPVSAKLKVVAILLGDLLARYVVVVLQVAHEVFSRVVVIVAGFSREMQSAFPRFVDAMLSVLVSLPVAAAALAEVAAWECTAVGPVMSLFVFSGGISIGRSATTEA